MLYFYKNTGGAWVVGGNTNSRLPKSNYELKNQTDGKFLFVNVNNGFKVFDGRLSTEISKNAAGDLYSNDAEFLAVVDDFFVDASGGGGDATTLGGHLPAYFETAGAAQSVNTQLLGGADTAYNTLKKLQDLIIAQSAIIGGSTPDGDSIVNTVAELLAVFSNFPEGSNMVTLLTAKLNTSDVYNALDGVIAGKALDARQGKVLKDLIDGLQTALNGKATPADIATAQAAAITAAATDASTKASAAQAAAITAAATDASTKASAAQAAAITAAATDASTKASAAQAAAIQQSIINATFLS